MRKKRHKNSFHYDPVATHAGLVLFAVMGIGFYIHTDYAATYGHLGNNVSTAIHSGISPDYNNVRALIPSHHILPDDSFEIAQTL